MRDESGDEQIEGTTRLRLTRRQMLRRAAALGVSAPAASALLVACSRGKKDSTPTATAGASSTASGAATPSAPAGATSTTDSSAPTVTAGGTATGAVATSSVSGTTTSPAPGPTGADGVINLSNVNGDTGVGNPILTNAVTILPYYLFSRLVIFDDSGAAQPELASRWEISEDGTLLTLTLVDAAWHDGQPFSADDVLFTFDTIKNEQTRTALRLRLQAAGDYLAWAAIDDRTVTLTARQAFAPLLVNLNETHIIPKHLLQDVADINTADFNRQPVGTGYFKFVDWQPNQHIRLQRNAEYFGSAPRAAGLALIFHADADASAAALDAGEVDLAFAPSGSQSQYENSPGLALHTYVYFTPITLAFNHKHPILSDVKVRQAIEMAIDKQSLTASVTQGRGQPAIHQFADGGPLDRYNNPEVAAADFDVDAANQLLDDAGYAMGDDGIRLASDGSPFSFTLITYAGFQEYVNAQAMLQEMLQQIGIEVKPQVVDYETLQAMRADPDDDPNNRAMELAEWPHPDEFDPDLYRELHSDNVPPGGNYMWFADDQCDALIVQGRQTVDPDERVSIYQQLDARRAEVLPCIPLYIAVDGWAASDRLQGVADSPYFRRYLLTNAKDWRKES